MIGEPMSLRLAKEERTSSQRARERKDEEMRALNSERLRSKERTVIIQARHPVGNLPKAMSAPESGPIHTSWSRMDHLYRIGKILAEFASTTNALEATLAIVSNTLPFRTAILIHEVGNHADLR